MYYIVLHCYRSYRRLRKINSYNISLEDLLHRINNKSVFDENEIRVKYNNERNLVGSRNVVLCFFGPETTSIGSGLKNNDLGLTPTD